MKLSQTTRAYLYRILTAAAALALVLGVATDVQLVAYLGLASAILGLGTASNYTSPAYSTERVTDEVE